MPSTPFLSLKRGCSLSGLQSHTISPSKSCIYNIYHDTSGIKLSKLSSSVSNDTIPLRRRTLAPQTSRSYSIPPYPPPSTSYNHPTSKPHLPNIPPQNRNVRPPTRPPSKRDPPYSTSVQQTLFSWKTATVDAPAHGAVSAPRAKSFIWYANLT